MIPDRSLFIFGTLYIIVTSLGRPSYRRPVSLYIYVCLLVRLRVCLYVHMVLFLNSILSHYCPRISSSQHHFFNAFQNTAILVFCQSLAPGCNFKGKRGHLSLLLDLSSYIFFGKFTAGDALASRIFGKWVRFTNEYNSKQQCLKRQR